MEFTTFEKMAALNSDSNWASRIFKYFFNPWKETKTRKWGAFFMSINASTIVAPNQLFVQEFVERFSITKYLAVFPKRLHR